MKRLLISIFALLAAGFASAAEESRFAVYDITIDPGTQRLAAYQVTIRGPKIVQIVSVEGGEAIAFQTPPFFDPKALQKNRIKLAAYSTRPPEKLPAGKTRVASLHVQIKGKAEPAFEVEFQTTANHKAEKISCTLQIAKRIARAEIQD